jgi:hypothetical protein
MAALGYPCYLIRWVASFLHYHCVTVVIDGVPTVTFRCEVEGAPQGSALSVILFLLYINRLLWLLKAINVSVSWCYGFVDDMNFSTASKSPSQNVAVLNKAAVIASNWAKADGATFEHPKSELLHHSPGRADLSSYSVTFEGITTSPSDMVNISKTEFLWRAWRSVAMSDWSGWYGSQTGQMARSRQIFSLCQFLNS